jgi:hypothetical protein
LILLQNLSSNSLKNYPSMHLEIFNTDEKKIDMKNFKITQNIKRWRMFLAGLYYTLSVPPSHKKSQHYSSFSLSVNLGNTYRISSYSFLP